MKAINSWEQFCLLSKMVEKLQLISLWEAHCLFSHLYSGSFFCLYSSLCQKRGPLYVPLVAGILWLLQAAGGLWWKIQCRAWLWRWGGGWRWVGRKRRGEMRGRWEMSRERWAEGRRIKAGGAEVEERSVMNREATRTTRGRWKPELQTDRQAGQRVKPRAVHGGQAEDQSCLPSLPESPLWR